jgi:hypothetical protein
MNGCARLRAEPPTPPRFAALAGEKYQYVKAERNTRNT